MAYGLKYICTFDNLRLDIPATPEFTVQFLFKDYSGATFNIKGGVVPIIHSYETDDPHAAIKGSSLTLSVVNEAQSLPITSFFSNEDDGIKVIFLQGGQTMFEGFLVQDDCIESLVDFNHEVSLTATDNLGLLKNVTLDVALRATIATFTANITGVAPNTIRMLQSFGATINVGDILVITNSSIDGTYTVVDKFLNPPLRYFTVAETVPDATVAPATILQQRGDLNQMVTLLTIVKATLGQTGVFLSTNIYANIAEITHDPTYSFLEQTLIDPQSFNKGNDDYEDCYSVLEKILKRFNLTVFQSSGLYNIVRWDELMFYNNLIHGYLYDADFNFVAPIFGDLFLPAPINVGIAENIVWQSAPDHRVLRPFLYDKETFNYKQPTNLLRNSDLQELGSLITAYTVDSGVDLKYVNEYDAKNWFDSSSGHSNPGVDAYRRIRVVQDYKHKEIERYLVVANDNIQSYQIEATKGDTFEFSFSFRTENTQPGPVTLTWAIRLFDGTRTEYVKTPGDPNVTEPGWDPTIGWTYQIANDPDDTKEWHTVTIESLPIPYDGLLYMELIKGDLELTGGPDAGTYYKDINFKYNTFISGSQRIIGHKHTSIQGGNIKQNGQEEIFMDDSPRSSIAGTLFLEPLTGILRTRTTQWLMPGGTAVNLGELTTSETIAWRRVPRSIIEGTLVGGLPQFVSILNTIKYNYYPDLNLVWGKLDIDYRNNTMKGTLFEMWKDSDTDLPYNYVFNYLYDTK